ncbi:MAG: hypothetical protein AAF215_06360 [Cyanobacteria bacterium P01_A01_bin.123]
MAQRLKRWESPRRQGRNAKGKGGSARKRQYLKQQQQLRQRLKRNESQKSSSQSCGGEVNPSLFLCIFAVFTARRTLQNKGVMRPN